MSESGPGRHLNQPVMSAPSHPIHLYISGCSAEKSALHNAVQDGKDAAVHWNSGIQAHLCADVGVSPQCESGTGRQGQSRQEPVLGRSFFPLVAMLGGSVLAMLGGSV